MTLQNTVNIHMQIFPEFLFGDLQYSVIMHLGDHHIISTMA